MRATPTYGTIRCVIPQNKKIYIAWSNKQDSYSFTSTLKAVEAAGFIPVVLPMIRFKGLPYDDPTALVDEHGILLPQYAELVKAHTWYQADLSVLPDDLDCLIFAGGDDVSPSLCSPGQPWHGKEDDTEYSALRDISDYLLMTYALDHDIPLFAICRGMQLLAMVYGAKMIGDLPEFFKDNSIYSDVPHRDPNKEIFTAHDVMVTEEDSLLYRCAGKKLLAKTPSWHHQGVASVEGTSLRVTAVAEDNIIEALEDPAKRFVLGVQFHPEVAVRKWYEDDKDASRYMDFDTAVSFIVALDKARAE